MKKELVEKPINYVYNETFDIEIKDWLTLDDIQAIVNGAQTIDDYIQRDYWINCAVLGICVPNGELDGMDYDLLMANGLIHEVIATVRNYDMIYHYLEQYQSTREEVKQLFQEIINFLKNVEKKMPAKKEMKATLDFLKEKFKEIQ